MISKNIHHFNKAFASAQVDEHRKGGRFRTSSVMSGLGRVLDLSHCGAMVVKRRFCKVPAVGRFDLTLRFEELHVTVTARVARQSKQRGFGHLLGLEFLDVTESQREAIKEIIRDSRCWETLPFMSGNADQDAA